ncbi:MAG TPA: hypothetical protein P5102_18135, partial [Candidatus Competibacteraceae bacterium]|nr:hypothetical protein [Candidatus Competibacteraceae bacterium]
EYGPLASLLASQGLTTYQQRCRQQDAAGYFAKTLHHQFIPHVMVTTRGLTALLLNGQGIKPGDSAILREDQNRVAINQVWLDSTHFSPTLKALSRPPVATTP